MWTIRSNKAPGSRAADTEQKNSEKYCLSHFDETFRDNRRSTYRDSDERFVFIESTVAITRLET